MNNDEIQAQIERIRQERATKGGRMANAEKAQIEHLEAMLNIPEDAEMSETTEETETPSTGMVRVEIACNNICVPMGEKTVLAYEGEIHTVPASFLEIAGDRVTRV